MMSLDHNNDTSDKDTPDVIEDDGLDIKIDEQSKRNNLARKRIDDLLEKKRLKELLDDEDDWEV